MSFLSAMMIHGNSWFPPEYSQPTAPLLHPAQSADCLHSFLGEPFPECGPKAGERNAPFQAWIFLRSLPISCFYLINIQTPIVVQSFLRMEENKPGSLVIIERGVTGLNSPKITDGNVASAFSFPYRTGMTRRTEKQIRQITL